MTGSLAIDVAMPIRKARSTVGLISGLVLCLLLALPDGGATQTEPPAHPFALGEVLSYRAVSSRFGTIGTGTMRVDGPEEVRGHSTMRLSFDFKGRVGPFKMEDQTRSWLVASEMTSLRYTKRERSPLGSRTEEVDIFPAERRWTSVGKPGGSTAAAAPLDELSFLYYIRCLPLEDGRTYSLALHYDPLRNPVEVKVLRRERSTVPAGEFSTVVVEMRVKDSRFGGNGVLVLYLTDDEAHVPVRIDSSAPWVARTRMLLESVQGARLTAR
jgi:hypothetical protein